MILTYTAHGSRIHGRGMFACEDAMPGERILLWADAVGYNHSCNSNACLIRWIDGVYYVRALRPIRAGEEVTVDYRVSGLRPTFACTCPVCDP